VKLNAKVKLQRENSLITRHMADQAEAFGEVNQFL
jgi:hypothetical protein